MLQRVSAVEGVRAADPAHAAAARLGVGAGARPTRRTRAGAGLGARARGGSACAAGHFPPLVPTVPVRASRTGRCRYRASVTSAPAPRVFLQRVHVLPQTVLYIADAETFSGHEECHEHKKGTRGARSRRGCGRVRDRRAERCESERKRKRGSGRRLRHVGARLFTPSCWRRGARVSVTAVE